jgi:hypothetical protein
MGGHAYATSTIWDSCYGLVHSFISGDFTTNTTHTNDAFMILARIMKFYEAELLPTHGERMKKDKGEDGTEHSDSDDDSEDSDDSDDSDDSEDDSDSDLDDLGIVNISII